MMRLVAYLSIISGVLSTQTSMLRRKLAETAAECVNTAPHDGLDQGCDAIQPMCFLSTGYEPGADVAGDNCGKCINTIDSTLFADLGCPSEAPLCDAPLGKGGAACLSVSLNPPKCTNTAVYGGVDAGCSRETPICTNSKTGMEVGAHAAGDLCVACLKVFSKAHYRNGFVDYGCGSRLPRCMTSDSADPVTLRTGGKCCTAEGICQTESACPCNRPESIWSKAVAGMNPWNSNDLTCISDSSSITASLFVTGTPLGIGVSEVVLSDSIRWWVCSDQPREARTISEAEGRACYGEVQAATQAMRLSDCLSY